MLHGYAWYVRHPRRKGQDFVSCDTKYVAKEVDIAFYNKWNMKITLVGFRGDGALQCLTHVRDLIEHLHARTQPFVCYNPDTQELIL